jgi:lactate dehydrogenase-like 2-hydroxyacid dehydrogenase
MCRKAKTKVDPKSGAALMETPVILAPPQVFKLQPSFFGDGVRIVTYPEGDLTEWARTEGKDVRAMITWGSIELPDIVYDLPRLGLISCPGAGYERIDLAKCRARGIAVTNCAGMNAEDVADVAMGLMLSTVRLIAAGDRLIRSGGWVSMQSFPLSRRLRGMKCGVAGFGAIGTAIAHRAAAFGMEIAWWGPRPKPEAPYPRLPDLHALASWCDVLALAMPGSAVHVVDASILEALGPQGVVINVGRGTAINEAALLAALKEKRIAGAGLDVFVREPDSASPWADLENVTLTPHFGGATRESVTDTDGLMQENLRRFLAGEKLLSVVPELAKEPYAARTNT